MTERRFLSWLFGSALVGAVLTALLCFTVDPYLVFNSPRLVGINHIKSALTRHEPMMKAYQASRSCGKTVILGSSRAGLGLDPEAVTWPAAMRPVYNLSLAGTDLEDGLLLLAVLLAGCGGDRAPSTLVVGLDFEAFLHREAPLDVKAAPRIEPSKAQEERLRQLAHERSGSGPSNARLWKDAAAALLTFSALADSLGTIIASARSAGANLLSNGKSSDWLLRQWTLAEGPGALFHQKHTLTAQRYAVRHRLNVVPGSPAEALPAVSALLDLAQRHKLVLRLGVQPSHVTHHELMDALGYWSDFERWKVAIAAAAQAGRDRGLDVVAWDFGDYEVDFQQEVAPVGGDRTPMLAFWDPVHYNEVLGRRVIAGLVGDVRTEPILGAELRPETVDQRNQEIRRHREVWRKAHVDVVSKVERYACGSARCSSLKPGP